MGKVIIRYKSGKLESFKCKSKERAEEIADKRRNTVEWNYYENNERVIIKKKKKQEVSPTSLEELELLLRMQGLF